MTAKAMVEPLNTKAMTAADLVEMIAHKEQIGIWANEIATAISLGDMLKEDWSFDDSVDLEREIVAQLRDVLSSAFSHPAYDIASRVQSLEAEVKMYRRALFNLHEAVDCEIDIGAKSSFFRKKVVEARAALSQGEKP